jgi:glycosyltransferase involved in cell wall biosynthesis
VSVVIPAYNAAAYISGTLQSVFEQTFSSFEVILVNDGSPDTAALEPALHSYLSRICYLRQKNRGPSSARNSGILKAQGQFVAFLDSDDFWLPHHLENQIETLQRDPELGLVYSNVLHLEQNAPIGVAFDTVPQSGEPTFESLLAERCTVNTSSVVVRRDILLGAGLFDESMNRCEDFDLWLRIASAGVRMAYDREIQVCHRLDEGLSADRILMKRGRIRAYQKATARPGLTATQQASIRKKLVSLELEIEKEQASQALLAGQYEEALLAATRAHSHVRSGKLRMAIIGLRYFPALLRTSYAAYIEALHFYKRARRKNSIKNLEIAGRTFNLDLLIRHLQELNPQRSLDTTDVGPVTR